MDKVIIGIDPGTNGGIAISYADGSVEVIKMPTTIRDIYETFSNIKSNAEYNNIGVHCYIEDVGKGMPGQSSSATAKFARHMGNLEMALTATKIPFTFVLPTRWMKSLSLGTSKNYPTKIAWKNHIKDRSQQEFPDIKVTLWNADALLIMLYGTRV